MTTSLAAVTAPPAAADPVIAQSDRLYARAAGLIPGHTQTLAKGPGQHVFGIAPKYLRRGKGAWTWDVDGNRYLDMSMAIGPLVLGHGHPSVDAAIRRQLEDGITFSLMHPFEVEVAETISALCPGAESVRFSKTGADVTSAAVRLTRAFTGKSRVLCCGYHGWHDWYIGVTDRRKGIPEEIRNLTHTVPYNDLAAVEQALDDETACVILEPVVFEAPKPDYLKGLKAACARRGALLVFDEMWTGFRLALGGAAQLFGVTPDLATYSKAIANGMPLSVLAGRRDVMRLLEKDVFFYTTFGGEALSLAAAKATLEVLDENDVPAVLGERGHWIREGYNDIARTLGIDRFTRCHGMDARTIVTFDATAGDPLELRSFVQQELVRRGVLWSGFHNVSYAHDDAEISFLLETYEEVLPLLRDAVGSGRVRSLLRGKPVEPVFRRTSHFDLKPKTRA